jgi:hypothetical protein
MAKKKIHVWAVESRFLIRPNSWSLHSIDSIRRTRKEARQLMRFYRTQDPDCLVKFRDTKYGPVS